MFLRKEPNSNPASPNLNLLLYFWERPPLLKSKKRAARTVALAAVFCGFSFVFEPLCLLQKTVYNVLFGFFFGQSQGHQLNELLTCDLADGCLVNK